MKKKRKKGKGIILILLLLILLLGPMQVGTKIQKIIYPREYSNIVEIYAEKYQVEENLIYAIIKAESNFKIQATSGKGAKGLMQLMEDTAKDVAKKIDLELTGQEVVNRLLEPDLNIELGTKYMKILLERYESIEIALTAYNAGIGTVDTWIEKGIIQKDGSDIENIPYKETNNYVRKIVRDYKIYQKLYQKD